MHFDDRAATWDEDPDKVARSAEVAAAVRRHLDIGDRPRTLEVGAGTGLLSRALVDVLGPTTLADSSAAMLDVARQVIADRGLDHWEAVAVDLDDGELPCGPYDLVLSQLALHHLRDPRGVLERVRGVLAPGGHVAVADLDRDKDGAFHVAMADFDGHHGFDRVTVERWLADLGFENVELSTATTLTKAVDGRERGFPLFLATGRRGP